jgi:hypothetical protein
MKNSRVPSIAVATPRVFLLLLLMLLTIHSTAFATLYPYTYTSPVLPIAASYADIPELQPRGSLTISYTRNSPIPSVNWVNLYDPYLWISGWSMTYGGVTINSDDPGVWETGIIFNTGPDGLPTRWFIDINMTIPQEGRAVGYGMGSLNAPDNWVAHTHYDGVTWWDGGEPVISANGATQFIWGGTSSEWGHPGVLGTWTLTITEDRVPLPPTVLLLGSGLLGLVGCRRFRKC